MPAVYCSYYPNACTLGEQRNYQIYLHAPEDEDLVEVRFRLFVDNLPGPPVVVPASGVTIGSIDVSSSPYLIEASWTMRPLVHEPIITLEYPEPPPFSEVFQFWADSVAFRRGDGREALGRGLYSIGGCCFDCARECRLDFDLGESSPIRIPIGIPTLIPFEWSMWCFGDFVGSYPLEVSDTEGWVVGTSTGTLYRTADCGQCVHPTREGTIEVLIPKGVSAGTISTMTIVTDRTSKVVLEATAPTAVVRSTLGGIKERYK